MLGRNTRYQPTFRTAKRIEIERMADKKRPRTPERTADQVRLTRRTFVFKGLAASSFIALTARLWQIQIRDHVAALGQVQVFSQRIIPLTAARGLIYDRNRKLLADNIKSWSVAIVPASLPDDDTAQGEADRRAIFTMLAKHLGMSDIAVIRPKELPEGEDLRDEIYTRLAIALGIPTDEVRDPIEREIALAATKKRAPQRSIKVPAGEADLKPEQVAAASLLQDELPGVHVINPIDYQVAIFGAYDPYTPLLIRNGVSKEIALGIEANRLYFPGVQISDKALTRRYLVGEELGHILGYTGPITGEEWQAAVVRDERGQPVLDDEGDPIPLYRQRDVLGKSGVESGLEALLRGKPGHQVAQINAAGKIVGEFAQYRVAAVNGGSVVLTIPLDYQHDVIAILQKGIDAVKPYLEDQNIRAKESGRPDKVRPIPVPAGAAVAIDPRNGEILAMVSLPGYDPKHFAEGISQKQLDIYLEKDLPDSQKRFPLQNRCVANMFPPGSTLKTFIAAAGLYSGHIKPDTKFKCMGHIEVPTTWNEFERNKYWCWTRDFSHQDLDVREALATSCDVFFYNVGAPKQQDERGVDTHYYQPGGQEPQWFQGLGIESINEVLRLFGFGDRSGVELGDEVKGLVPGISWKAETFPGDYWSLGDTIITSIGQGYDLVTPLQLCNATAAVANAGTLYKPTLVHEILDDQGKVVRGPQATPIRKLPINRQHLEIVREGMRMNLTYHRDNSVKGLVAPLFDEHGNAIPGTEQFPLPPGIDAGVKTGTAEYGTDVDDDGLLLHAHAWCTAFAPYNNPEICVVAFVEGGAASAAIAAPIASEMINAWFARKTR